MYTVSENRPRGSSAGQSNREFPVLFHLMDVSRPKAVKQTSTIDSANLLNAVEQLRWPPAEQSEPSSPPATQPTSDAATNETEPAIDIPPTESDETTLAAPEPTSSAENTLPDEQPAADASPLEESSVDVEATSPAPPPSPLVTLRKKHRTSASEDWFASHGKYIAVAFVLALVATIYFARVNRERSIIAKQEPTSQPSVIETTPAVAATSQPRRVSAPTAPTVQTASAAAPRAPSPVELRAPQLVEPSVEKQKDNLFEFAAAKNADDRIAARPDDAAKSTVPALTAPALTPPSQPTAAEVIATPAPQAAAATATTEASAYPTTSSPATHYPVSIPPPTAYPSTSPSQTSSGQPSAPVLAPPGSGGYQPPQSRYGVPAPSPNDYRSQYPVTPASMPPQQPAAQPWNAGQPTSYPSYDTTARGPRNERTGSGNY